MGTRAILAAAALLLGASATVVADPSPALQRVAPGNLCVTNGTVQPLPDGRFSIDTASSRAVLRSMTAAMAEIRFRYVGPSAQSKPLASGELRRQIGIKLHAQDTCNLLYAMWHIAPDSHIAVLVKSNPGQHRHEQCDAHGYQNLKPVTSRSLPPTAEGTSHVLRAELRGTSLTVTADGVEAWQGDVGTAVTELQGPVGLRTDNARFEFEFLAGAPEAASGSDPAAPPGNDPDAFYHCAPDGAD